MVKASEGRSVATKKRIRRRGENRFIKERRNRIWMKKKEDQASESGGDLRKKEYWKR